MIFMKAHTSRANAMLIADLINIFLRKLIYFKAFCQNGKLKKFIWTHVKYIWRIAERIVLKSYLNASGLHLKAFLERGRFPVEKVQTRLMSPPSVRLGRPGKHQVVSKSGNLEIFFWILRQFGDVLKMLEMFWRCLSCALQEYFASGSGNVRNFRMQQVSSCEYITTQHTGCFIGPPHFQ